MEETLKKVTGDIKGSIERTVTLVIRSNHYVLNGIWTWDLHADSIFASDVMFFPDGFEGTRGIIHPEDVPVLNGMIDYLQHEPVRQISFRLITTYGEIKVLEGKDITIAPEETDLPKPSIIYKSWEYEVESQVEKKEQEQLRLQKLMNDQFDKLLDYGSWFINKTTGVSWYSDHVFRIYGLPPQSLNAHANTFHSFIHSADRMLVLDAFDNAYHRELPLHIEYRIELPDGNIRMIRQLTCWLYNGRGHHICCGVIIDVTEQIAVDGRLQSTESDHAFYKQLLDFTTSRTQTAFWYINLATQKAFFSESYYRISGLKNGILCDINASLKCIHPEDKDFVRDLINKMHREHVLEDAEFRIVRPDGKLRYIRQSGKLTINGDDLLMVGIIQDMTEQKILEERTAEAKQASGLHETLQNALESAGDLSYVIWMPGGYMKWSDSFYKLLGYRPGSIESLPLFIYKNIHPKDLKTYKDAETLVLNHQNHADISVRMISRSGMSQISISFWQTTLNDEHAVIGVFQNRTTEAVLQQQLSESNRFTQLVSGSIKAIIFQTNLEHTITSWSDMTAQLTGVPAEEAVHANLFDIFPLLNNGEYMVNLHSARAGAAVQVVGARTGYMKTPVNYQLQPIRNDQEEVTGVLHLVQDVSKEYDLQQQLNERLNFIESLVEASVDRIVVLDQYMNYIYWNHKAEEYYAITKQKVLGKNILEVFPAFRNDPSYQEFRRVLRGETVHIPASLNENETEYAETYLTPIKDDKGNVTAVLWVVHDLSLEWKIQEARNMFTRLQELEHRRLKEAQAIGHIGSFEWNRSSNEIFWSDELYRIYGMDPRSRKVTLDDWFRFVAQDELTWMKNQVMQLYKEAKATEFSHHILLGNGEVRKLIYKAESFAVAGGEVDHITGTVQDITNIERTDLILQAVNEVCFELDNEFILRYANRKAFEVWQKAPEEIIGQSYWHIFPEDVGTATEDVLRTALKEQRQIKEEAWSPVMNKWLLLNVSPSSTGLIAMSFDITEQVEARKLARERHQQFVSLVENIPDAVTRWDKELRLVFANSASEHKTGKTLSDLAGKTGIEMGFPEEVTKPWMDKLRQVFETGQPVMHYNDFHTPEGVFTYYTRMVPEKNPDGEVQTVLALGRDITELIKAEEKLKTLNRSLELQNNELAVKNEELSSFAFIASHDLREPLRKVQVFSQWLQEAEKDKLSDKGQRLIEKTIGNINKMDTLIDEMLVLSRLHHGQKKFTEVSVAEVLANVRTELKEQIASKNATMELAELPQLAANENQLFYLFYNLISNSLKFHKDGIPPAIKVAAKKLRGNEINDPKAMPEQDYWRITVEDNGIGFNKKEAPKIFQIFQRLNGYHEFPGHGIGLSICSKVMENHQGFINVDSAEGEGTTFCCYFPAKDS